MKYGTLIPVYNVHMYFDITRWSDKQSTYYSNNSPPQEYKSTGCDMWFMVYTIQDMYFHLQYNIVYPTNNTITNTKSDTPFLVKCKQFP